MVKVTHTFWVAVIAVCFILFLLFGADWVK